MLVVKCTMSAFQGDKGDTVSFHNNCCFSLKISSKAKLFMYKINVIGHIHTLVNGLKKFDSSFKGIILAKQLCTTV